MISLLTHGRRQANNWVKAMPQTVVRLYRDATGATPIEQWLESLETSDSVIYAKCLNVILLLHNYGYELRRPQSDALADGIRELRVRKNKVHYRILYFACGENVVCLSHGITKEGKVPEKEIAIAKKRMLEVQSNLRKYTKNWTVQ